MEKGKTYILLRNTHRFDLPAEFQHDDVRLSENLVEHFLREFTQENNVVFDPFAGYGTTLLVAEAMGRVPYGIEFDERRVQYTRSKLKHPENLIHGDSRQLASYDLPVFDFSITSPPYMGKCDKENPLTAYTTEGSGYAAYLCDIRNIYEQMKQMIKPDARVVIEVANLKLCTLKVKWLWAGTRMDLDTTIATAWFFQSPSGTIGRRLHFDQRRKPS